MKPEDIETVKLIRVPSTSVFLVFFNLTACLNSFEVGVCANVSAVDETHSKEGCT